MTPKEKAKELYTTYIDYTFGDFNCKQCTLIAVDEILNVLIGIYDYDYEVLNPYWQEVKQEIEKL
jgi:hypothetical protein